MAKTSSFGGLLHFLGTGLTLCERGEEAEGRGEGRGEDWGWLWTLELSRLQSDPAIQHSHQQRSHTAPNIQRISVKN